jgi:hypothetical protein
VVSEEKIFEKVLDGRRMPIDGTGELKRPITPKWVMGFTSKLQVM